MKNNNGFTLVELIVGVSVTTLIGIVLTGILTQSIRGQNKAQLIGQIKQNSQVSLDKISNLIRQSDQVICPDNTVNTTNSESGGTLNFTNNVVVLYQSGQYSRIMYFPVRKSIYYDHPQCSGDDTNPSCGSELCQVSAPPTGAYPLTDSSLEILEDPQNTPVFTRSYKPGYADIITVKFLVKQVGVGQFFESSVSEGIPYGTSVQVRGK